MKRGCPYCCNSQGEKEVLRILKNNNINYQTQKTFINCKSKRSSKFDFYLPEYNLAIEYDGRQHFEKVDAWGGDSTLKQIQYRDNIKTNYCYDNDIILCRIRYDENIYNVLSEYLELRKNKDG